MKNLFVLIAAILFSSGCTSDGEYSTYVFEVENLSSDTLLVCRTNVYRQSNYQRSTSCYQLIPKSSEIISSYTAKGELIDYWTGSDPVIFEDFEVYMNDLTLINKNFLNRKLWSYSQTTSYQSQYTLVITNMDLN